MKHLLLTTSLSALFLLGCGKKDDTPNSNYEPIDTNATAYKNAKKSLGGIMYDKIWAEETGFDSTNLHYSKMKANGDFFRCKQCHGWDGLGTKGAYISRSPKKNRPKVSELNLYELAQTKTAKELFDGIKKSNGRRSIDYDFSTYDPNVSNSEGNKMPDYSKILTDAEIWNMVKFLKEGLRDVKNLYDFETTGTYPTGTITYSNIGKNGDAKKGKSLYATNCASCHGDSGLKINLDGKTVGEYGRKKAYEVHHKITYGQPGSSMKGLFDLTDSQIKDLYKALQNTTDFPDSK